MATLSYAYAERVVWIEVLSGEAHPMTHDLCTDHADHLRVPRGWEQRDRREAANLHTGQIRLIPA